MVIFLGQEFNQVKYSEKEVTLVEWNTFFVILWNCKISDFEAPNAILRLD